MAFMVVGLTGGIGSGKSTVARFFGELGVPVVDADRVARDVVAKGSDGLAAVVEAFGEEVLTGDGELDRAGLAKKVFADDALRRKLEGILHPRIAKASMEKLAALAAEGHPYAIYEAALLVENGTHEMLGGPLVVVAASEATQIERVRARDGATEEEARARMAAQRPLADKIAVADHVIHNDGDLEATKAATRAVHELLSARAKEGERG